MRPRYWRTAPPTMYRRSRLRSAKPVVDPTYVGGSDFDEFRHELKAARAERDEFYFGPRGSGVIW